MRQLFRTNNAWHSLVLRVVLGIVMFPHGAQKLFGWFGGYGFGASMNYFTGKMHIPVALALVVIIAESIGSLGLIIGFLTRVAAFGILCDMIGAILLVHWPYGFFMNWSGKAAGEGFEYHLLVLSISVAILTAGAGKWSVDGAIAAKLKDN